MFFILLPRLQFWRSGMIFCFFSNSLTSSRKLYNVSDIEPNFTEYQFLNQEFHNVSDYELKILRVKFRKKKFFMNIQNWKPFGQPAHSERISTSEKAKALHIWKNVLPSLVGSQAKTVSLLVVFIGLIQLFISYSNCFFIMKLDVVSDKLCLL